MRMDLLSWLENEDASEDKIGVTDDGCWAAVYDENISLIRTRNAF